MVTEDAAVTSVFQQGVVVDHLCKSYADGDSRLLVIDNLSISAAPGQFVSIFGPNGCGKTTLLNVVAGLVPFDSGTASVGGKPPGTFRAGYVFQDYERSLFPWRRAIDNIGLPLEATDGSVRSRRHRVQEFLVRCGIRIPLGHFPYQMSGGQKQLTALARALVGSPHILLMDEPFGALDYQTRLSMADELLRVWHHMRITTLFVSHEIDEAIYLADKLYILSPLPASVVETLEVNLPRPRTRRMLGSEEFLSVRARAIEAFWRNLTP